jgi:alpha-mannosidase
MLPDNPFLQLVLPRAASVLGRLQALIWSPEADVEVAFGGSFVDPMGVEEASELSFRTVELPFSWGNLFEQGWFRVLLPEHSGELYLHWYDQGEGTVYRNGVPFYGFDVAHRFCKIPSDIRELLIEGLCLQSAIWHPEAKGLNPAGSTLSRVGLFRRNELAWEVYHDVEALYQLTVEEAKAASPGKPLKTLGVGYQEPVNVVPVLYRRLLRGLDDIFNAFNRGGLEAAKKVVSKVYSQLSGQHERIRAVLTGHAHIDLVWLWPETTGEYKAVHTFSTMNRLMDSYPELMLGHSQPASYSAVERRSPKLMAAVRERMASGRWEAIGATEVESDTQMACGEALARSFLLGQRGFECLSGSFSRVLWIPDVFGYAGCLPQIMKQTGVDYFFTTKLTWSNIHLFPYSSFVWRGIDGSEVLVHVTQENGYNQLASAEELRRGAQAYRQSDVHDEFLAPTGYGDGGGGVTEEMCERARRYRSLGGMPEVQWGSVMGFFDRLNHVRAKLPVYQGELYLEYHRGVFTTHGDLKARFRECERALQTWEAVRSATGGGVLDDGPWKRLVFAQFHDYIPGSSIWEVYEEGLPELAAISEKALESAAAELGNASAGGDDALFNPLPLARTLLVPMENHRKRAVTLSPLSGAPIHRLPVPEAAGAVEASAFEMASDFVKVAFDPMGQISALSFCGKEVALSGALGAVAIYPDYPAEFEAWDIDRQNLSLGRVVDSTADAFVAVCSREEGVVEFRRKLSERSEAVVRYRLDAFNPVLHIEMEIDWHDEQALLRLLFPTAYSGRSARFGTPFGSVLRGQQPGNSREEAMFEGPASRWAVIGDDGETEGLGVVTEAKYGFSARNGVLGVTLLRSPRVTGEDRGHSSIFPAPLRHGGKRSAYSDLGHHTIRMAVYFQSPQASREHLGAALAETLFTEPVRYRGEAVQAGFLGLEGGETLVPAWAKPAEDGQGWILRLHETMGRRGSAKLRLAEGYAAYATDLSERKEGAEAVGEVRFTPYSLISLRILEDSYETK